MKFEDMRQVYVEILVNNREFKYGIDPYGKGYCILIPGADNLPVSFPVYKQGVMKQKGLR